MVNLQWVLQQARHYDASHIHVETDGSIRLRMGSGLKELCMVDGSVRQKLLEEIEAADCIGWRSDTMETLQGTRAVLERIQPWAEAKEIQARLKEFLDGDWGVLVVACPIGEDINGLVESCRPALGDGWELHGRNCRDLAIAQALLRARGIQATHGLFAARKPDGLWLQTEVFPSDATG